MLESVIDDDSYLDPMLSDEESVSNDERSEISENSDNDENIIDEQFTAPNWDDFNDNGDFAYLNSSTEFSESWILLWIYKYQSRFHLSDVAINSLIQFFGQVLKDTDPKRFYNFPSSSHNAKKLLQIAPYITPVLYTEKSNGWNQSRLIIIPRFVSANSGIKNRLPLRPSDDGNIFHISPS